MYFRYDGDTPIGFALNGTEYYYVTNLQGDVIAILNDSGTCVAEYEYDAWGNCTVTKATDTIAYDNPLRYRGYYYDYDTELYYLQSRFYDANTGRFINADEPTLIGANGGMVSNNLFAYCDNNPVNKVDSNGNAAINIVFAAVGGVVGWFFGDWVAKKLGYKSGWKYWAIRLGVVAGGAVLGWFAGSLITKILAKYLKSHPEVIFKIMNKLGVSKFNWAMKALGINPFSVAMNSSKFVAIARLFNSKAVIISYQWAVKLYEKAKYFGFKVSLDRPHGGYTWHIHLSGKNGKLNNLHIQIAKKAWDYLCKIIK